MKIAILGANSQIAKDLTRLLAASEDHRLTLFVRQPEILRTWMSNLGINEGHEVAEYSTFNAYRAFDVVINCVGVGDPAKALLMGSAIFDVTQHYDELGISYLKKHKNCRYIYLSSGAAYGQVFDKGATQKTEAIVPINNLQPQDWYGVAKLYAECRHRAQINLPITDIRIFNYFSHTQDLSGRFLIADIVNAIKNKTVLKVTLDNVVRDYVGPEEVYQLLSAIISAPPKNTVVDCYSKGPVDKFLLLSSLKERFGLEYELTSGDIAIKSTGLKSKYFSLNRRAEEFHYFPKFDALEVVLRELSSLMDSN